MRVFGIGDTKLIAVTQRAEHLGRSGLRILRAQPARRWASMTEIAAVIGLAGISAQLVWSLAGSPAWPAAPAMTSEAAPAKPRGAWQNSVLTTLDPFHRNAGTASAATERAPETMLDLQLFGIRAGDGGGSAIIAGSDNIQQAYFVGQEIMPGVRLERVLPGRVTIRRNGVAESLSLDKERPQSAPTQAAAESVAVATAVPAEDTWRRVNGDIAVLLAGVKFTARAEGGVVLQSGAALAQFGIAPGDILVAVNGTPVRDAASLMAVTTAWRDAERLSLEIERNGQRKIHKIAIDR